MLNSIQCSAQLRNLVPQFHGQRAIAGGTKLGADTTQAEWQRDAAIGRKRGRAAMGALVDTLVDSNTPAAQGLATPAGCTSGHGGGGDAGRGDGVAAVHAAATQAEVSGKQDARDGDLAEAALSTAHAVASGGEQDPGAADAEGCIVVGRGDVAACDADDTTARQHDAVPAPAPPADAAATRSVSNVGTAERRREVEALLEEAHPASAVRGAARGVVGGGLRASRTGAFDAAEQRAIAAKMEAASAAWSTAAQSSELAAPVYKVCTHRVCAPHAFEIDKLSELV